MTNSHRFVEAAVRRGSGARDLAMFLHDMLMRCTTVAEKVSWFNKAIPHIEDTIEATKRVHQQEVISSMLHELPEWGFKDNDRVTKFLIQWKSVEDALGEVLGDNK